MPNANASPGKILVRRAKLVTRDMDQIAELLDRMYVEHRAQIRRIRDTEPQASMHGVQAGPLKACWVRLPGIEYYAADADTGDDLMAMVSTRGHGDLVADRERLRVTRSEVFLAPPGQPYDGRFRSYAGSLLQIPMAAAARLAEAQTGLPAAQLRFESMAPVSESAAALLTRTVMFGCGQLIDSGVTEVSPLLVQEMTRLTAAVLLATFPNTTMTMSYVPGPGWVPPAAVRQAAAFIEGHADQPVSLAEIAAAAGVTGRALQYAFRRHYSTTPSGYLRRIRLEHARHELRAAQPGSGVTVAAVARQWGWANPAHFAAAYRRQFDQPPSQTLRT